MFYSTKITNNSPTFGANLKSPRLRLSQKDFFIKIRGYGNNSSWAKEIIDITDNAVDLIRNRNSADTVLQYISAGVKKANQIPFNLDRREHSGILRTKRNGYEYKQNDNFNEIITRYVNIPRYSKYAPQLNNTITNPLCPHFDKLTLTMPKNGYKNNNYLQHAKSDSINNALDIISKLYEHLAEKFKPSEVSNKDLKDIVNIISAMRWILAHATPWQRGSDAISNVFMRALFKAYGIKAYSPAKGTSFDFEAYCNNLNEYISKFQTFFIKPPKVIE